MNNLVQLAKKYNIKIATCESMTAGQIASTITNTEGASDVFVGGLITYMTKTKMNLLGIKEEFFEKNRVVSSSTAYIMAKKTEQLLGSNLTISVTGYAGPNDGKENGHVFFCIIYDKKVNIFEKHFKGERLAIKERAVKFIIEMAIDVIRRNRDE